MVLLPSQNKRFATALVFGVALSACAGPPFPPSAGGLQQHAQGSSPIAGSAKNSASMSFTFQTVDDPNSSVNMVTGIDAKSEIVGTIGSGSPSSPFQGYTSLPPYSTFQSLSYPRGAGTIATSVSSKIVAGYVINPGHLLGTWAFVDINNLWTVFKDMRGPKGSPQSTELLGVNEAEFGVGVYKTKTGANAAFEVIIPIEQFATLKPPGAKNAEATGINMLGDISGWETTGSGTEGFLLRAGAYYLFGYSGASTTKALGLNMQDEIVGTYQDSSGLNHGFILTNPTQSKSQQIWQSIDEPDAKGGTVITGINSNDDICGYYVDGSGVQHGFVATPS